MSKSKIQERDFVLVQAPDNKDESPVWTTDMDHLHQTVQQTIKYSESHNDHTWWRLKRHDFRFRDSWLTKLPDQELAKAIYGYKEHTDET